MINKSNTTMLKLNPDVQCILPLMMTLKLSQKVTCALAGRRPVHPPANDDFQIMLERKLLGRKL